MNADKKSRRKNPGLRILASDFRLLLDLRSSAFICGK